MESGINLTAIFVANLMGVILLGVVCYSNKWRWKDKSRENRLFRVMAIFVFVSCIVDCLDFYADGKPGFVNYLLVYGGNWWLFFTNLVILPCWVSFLCDHTGFKMPRYQKAAMVTLNLVGLGLLVANLFTPVVFGVSETNEYYRCSLFWYFSAIEALMLSYSIGLYVFCKRKGGILKFFPVWVFVVPVMLGIVLQSCWYGISVIWPFTAISLACIVTSLQNEVLFRDKLTGLYNRFYLDHLKSELRSGDSGRFFAMMIDLNGFKAVNDTFGHQVGDEALIDAARLIKDGVGASGVVVRYAGDEFVCVVNTQDEVETQRIIDAIRHNFERFNERADKCYRLSASLGCCKADLKQASVDELLNVVDQLMFEDKRRYYETHDRRNPA